MIKVVEDLLRRLVDRPPCNLPFEELTGHFLYQFDTESGMRANSFYLLAPRVKLSAPALSALNHLMASFAYCLQSRRGVPRLNSSSMIS